MHVVRVVRAIKPLQGLIMSAETGVHQCRGVWWQIAFPRNGFQRVEHFQRLSIA